MVKSNGGKSKGGKDYEVDISTFEVYPGEEFTIGEEDVKLPTNLVLEINDDSGAVQEVTIHTSCSDDIFVDDIFGSLQLIRYVGRGGVSVPCNEGGGPFGSRNSGSSGDQGSQRKNYDACFGCSKDVDGPKPEVITFKYLPGSCPGENTQYEKRGCSGDLTGSKSRAIVMVKSNGGKSKGGKDYEVDISTFEVYPGEEFTIGEEDVKLPTNLVLEINDDSGAVQEVTIHTSCSDDIFVDDIFGSLQLIRYVGKGGVSVPCNKGGNPEGTGGTRRSLRKRSLKKRGRKSSFTSTIFVKITDLDSGLNLQHLEIHTSCSVPLEPYHTFGALQLLSATSVLKLCPQQAPNLCDAIPKGRPICDKGLKPFDSIEITFNPAACTKFEQGEKRKKQEKRNNNRDDEAGGSRGGKNERLLGGSDDRLACLDSSVGSTYIKKAHMFAYHWYNKKWQTLDVNPNFVEEGGSFTIKGPNDSKIEGNELIIESCSEIDTESGKCKVSIQKINAHISCSKPILGVQLGSFIVTKMSGNGSTQGTTSKLELEYKVFNPGDKTAATTVIRNYNQKSAVNASKVFHLLVKPNETYLQHDVIFIDNSIIGPNNVDIKAFKTGDEDQVALKVCDEKRFTANVVAS